jgi:hypothetical protein
MTIVAIADPPAASGVSVVRTIGKLLHWLVLGWTVFCGASFVMGLMRLAVHTAAASTSADPAATNIANTATGIGFAVGLVFWGLLWFLPVVGAELLALGLTVSAGKAASSDTNKREWAIAFLVALPPNGLLAILLGLQLFGIR